MSPYLSYSLQHGREIVNFKLMTFSLYHTFVFTPLFTKLPSVTKLIGLMAHRTRMN